MMRPFMDGSLRMTAQQTKDRCHFPTTWPTWTPQVSKRAGWTFKTCSTETVKYAGTPSPRGRRSPQASRWATGWGRWPPRRCFSQGMYQQTDNPLDVVIERRRVFSRCSCPMGPSATPGTGPFKIDAYGRLTDLRCSW